MNIITVLTDFGLKDPYVAIMKGVMLSANPLAKIVDITHEVGPQDLEEASFLIGEYYARFPVGTIHLCVVDPTVGSVRRPVVVSKDGRLFVGPDNGIFSLLFRGADARAWEIEGKGRPEGTISGTFHGRDVFAPAAARLSLGASPSGFGPAVTEPVTLPRLFPDVEGDVMNGKIVRFDRFGNAISNIAFDAFETFVHGRPFTITLDDLSFTALSRSYYEGRHTCLVGSSGYLEFGVFMGDLAAEKDLRKGDRVEVMRGAP